MLPPPGFSRVVQTFQQITAAHCTSNTTLSSRARLPAMKFGGNADFAAFRGPFRLLHGLQQLAALVPGACGGLRHTGIHGGAGVCEEL